MSKAIVRLLVLICTMVPALAVAGDLSYSGSITVATPILKAGAIAAFEAKTGIKFGKLEEPGSGKGIKALLADEVTIAGISRALKTEEKKEKLIGNIIGYDAIAIFIHKDNPVQNLTKEQLKGIFTGHIKNWKEVGGLDAAIVPTTEFIAGKKATVEVVQELVLDGAAYGPVKEMDRPIDQLDGLANAPNEICLVSLGLLNSRSPAVQAKLKTVPLGGVKPTDENIKSGAYLISRPLLLVTKGLPKDDVKEFINFMLSSEGQAFVAKEFVPVRK